MKAALALVLAMLMAGCSSEPPRQAESAGARLESAAARLGLVSDGRTRSLIGSWGLESDRACVVPDRNSGSRIGVLVDFGDGQGCAATGTVHRDGERLDVSLGAGNATCRFRARFDGERIVFPAEMPAGCLALCSGRATLDAFTVERISDSGSEAETLRTPTGQQLCSAS